MLTLKQLDRLADAILDHGCDAATTYRAIVAAAEVVVERELSTLERDVVAQRVAAADLARTFAA